MWTVITCIRDDHDLRFVLVAALLCVTGVVTALQFHRRGAASRGAARWSLMAMTGIVAGSAVWATHFVAMLAYHVNLPIRYDLGLTLLSLVVAMAGMGAGFAYAKGRRSLAPQIIGGGMIGLSIPAMHFIGIAAVQSAFAMEWDFAYVAASIVLSLAGAIGSLIALTRLAGWRRWVLSAASLVLGIVLLHFTAMAALTVVPDLSRQTVAEEVGRDALAVITAGISLLVVGTAVLLTVIERRSRKNSLRSLEVAFQGVPSGLAMYDAEGRLVLWNSAYEVLIAPYNMKPVLGMTRMELLGQAARSGTVPAAQVEGERDWAARIEGERLETDNSREWQTPNGNWLKAETSRLDNGGTISVLTDITSVKAATDAMAEARDRAEAASLAKSEFLANMSHEIRTPLNGVLGMAQVMDGDELAPAQRSRLKVIRESGATLLAILNDLLDLSKVQAGKLELEEGETDLAGLARQVGAAFEGAAAGRDLTLTVEADEAVTGLWRADGLRLRQILSNLIGNGLKFTHQGGVTLSVSASPAGVAFAVRDTGIGIDAEALPRLFEKFSQADASTTRQYGGTGLGLAICEELAALMGGTITAQSIKGEGSCFTVTLPLEQISREAPVAANEADNAVTVRRLRILAAEDNPTNQLVLRSLLEPIDCELVIANNGKEAVARHEVEEFDVILMDVQMPLMNGVEATLAIRESERVAGRVRTPIVALSANVMNHQLAEYTAAGMDGWVAKPIELEKLYAGLEAALSASETAQAA